MREEMQNLFKKIDDGVKATFGGQTAIINDCDRYSTEASRINGVFPLLTYGEMNIKNELLIINKILSCIEFEFIIN